MIGIYARFFYADSQMQLKSSFKYVQTMPVEYFYSAIEKSCGIWYESNTIDQIKSGRSNEKVKNCFRKSFANCESKNILLIKDSSGTSENQVIYSFIKILRPNDQNECIIQNFYEEHNLVNSSNVPLAFINTCTILKDSFLDSCEPLFIKEGRKTQTTIMDEKNNIE